MPIDELTIAILLFGWVMIVATILTRKAYAWMRRRGLEHNIALYYNRKIVHILAGGVCAIAVPYVFSTYLYPFLVAMLLAIFTYVPHKIGKLMYWFQTDDNMYEVTFAIMWGMIITLGWFVSGGDFLIGVLPVLFMSVGDAVTGIVRNFLYGKRTKSWWGNLAMALF